MSAAGAIQRFAVCSRPGHGLRAFPIFSRRATKNSLRLMGLDDLLINSYYEFNRSPGQPKMSMPNPTEGELAILRVLWSRTGPMTVRDVHEVLSRGKDTAYTTVLKMLTIMADKGLVRRD